MTQHRSGCCEGLGLSPRDCDGLLPLEEGIPAVGSVSISPNIATDAQTRRSRHCSSALRAGRRRTFVYRLTPRPCHSHSPPRPGLQRRLGRAKCPSSIAEFGISGESRVSPRQQGWLRRAAAGCRSPEPSAETVAQPGWRSVDCLSSEAIFLVRASFCFTPLTLNLVHCGDEPEDLGCDAGDGRQHGGLGRLFSRSSRLSPIALRTNRGGAAIRESISD